MIGKSREIKTMLIEPGYNALSDCINSWLEENPNHIIIDIKYQICPHKVYQGDGQYTPEVMQNALIIYKEGESNV